MSTPSKPAPVGWYSISRLRVSTAWWSAWWSGEPSGTPWRTPDAVGSAPSEIEAAVDAAAAIRRAQGRHASVMALHESFARAAQREAEGDAPNYVAPMMKKTPNATGSVTIDQLQAWLDAFYGPLDRAEQKRDARRRARERHLFDDYLDCLDAMARLGEGLRVEELAVITKRTEARILAALRHFARLGYLVDRGDRGWFVVQETGGEP
jgi:hypothetical protein